MGLNDGMSGYKKMNNPQAYSNEQIFLQLQQVSFSFGQPKMGTIQKKEAIVFDNIGTMTVYIKASDEAIEIGRAVTSGTGKFVLKELAVSMISNAQGKDMAEADRAVDEVYEVLKKFFETGAAEGVSETKDNIKLYMNQKMLTIRDKYNVCTLDQQPVYWVCGNLLGLKFAVEDKDGNPVTEIKKKLIAVMPEYTISQDGKEIATLKKKVRLTRPEILGTVNGESLQIKGDLSGYHFSIAVGDKIVGAVDTERLTWGDVYSIEVRDASKQDIIVTIAVIVDNLLKAAK